MAFPIDLFNRALRARVRVRVRVRKADPACLVCQRHVRQDEQRLHLRGETFIHTRCATYRMRDPQQASGWGPRNRG